MTSDESLRSDSGRVPNRRKKWFAIALVLVSTLIADQLIGIAAAKWVHPEAFAWPPNNVREILRRRITHAAEFSIENKNPNEFVIGIFGGSVAAHLADSHQLQTAPELDALRERTGKRVRFVRLASGGASQPAHFYLLQFFHTHLDAVVVLDGFNEMFEWEREGCDAFERSPEIQRELRESYEAVRADILSLARRSEQPWWPVLMLSGTYRLLHWREAVQLAGRERDALKRVKLAPPERELTATLRMWSTCVKATSDFARSKGLRSFFFLQPNQYVKNSKPMSEEEKRIAIRPHPGSTSVDFTYEHLDEIYGLFQQEIPKLREQGVAITSLVPIFENIREPVYVDSCCHVNDRGNRELASAVLRALNVPELVSNTRQ